MIVAMCSIVIVLCDKYELIHTVTKKNHDETEAYLMGGMDANIKDDAGNFLLRIATLNSDLKMVKLLINHGADVSHDRKEANSLSLSILNMDHEITHELLRSVLKSTAIPLFYEKCLKSAIYSENDFLLSVLLQKCNLSAMKVYDLLKFATWRGNEKAKNQLIHHAEGHGIDLSVFDNLKLDGMIGDQ